MKKAVLKLTPSMSLAQFDNGYWYVAELKEFAETIGIPKAGRLRKDELEKAIKTFLATGRVKSPTARSLVSSGPKDVERGLRPDLEVLVYTSDKETKDFLEREARKLSPRYKRRSGARYRLNRWREEQLTKGARITYGDLVAEYVRLSEAKESFARVPHGRYINFVADFLAAEKGVTRERVVEAWKELKTLDIPKTYRAWAELKAGSRR